MEIKWFKIEDVKPYENNAKLHDKTQIANVAESIKQFGWQQPIVVDTAGVIIVGHCRYLFGGSGSTLIACEQLNRTCYMMELDPKYVDVIINRWEQFTGEKAVLVGE